MSKIKNIDLKEDLQESDCNEEISRETLLEIQQFECDMVNNKVELISLEEFETELTRQIQTI